MKRTVCGIVLTMLLTGMLTLTFNIQPVKAWTGTVYIRADGSIDPSTAPMQRDGNEYTLTDNITSTTWAIVIERNSVVVDGSGYTIQGPGTGVGIEFNSTSNITIKNMTIKSFYYGTTGSSGNSFSENNITGNEYGLDLNSGNNVSGNKIASNKYGILINSANNVLKGNNITNNVYNLGFTYYGPVSSYIQDIDTSNTVNGKPVYYWINKRDLTVPNDAGFVGLVNSANISVENLNLTHNFPSVLLANTTDSTITENDFAHNMFGVLLFFSYNNSICGNIMSNNQFCSLFIRSTSNNNTIYGNTMMNNDEGIRIEGSSNNRIFGNNITASVGDNIVLLNLSGTAEHNNISANNLANAVGCGFLSIGCNYNDIVGNNMTNNIYGVGLVIAHNNIFSRNVITDNDYGVFLVYMSSSNTFVENLVATNDVGVFVDVASSNTFYHNNFEQNTQQVTINASGYPNSWNDVCEGNYWSDYNGTDLDHDGIGDTPYVFDENNQDNYPITNRCWNPGDVDHDLDVDLYDAVRLLVAYGSKAGDEKYDCHCDIAEPYGIINLYDAVLLLASYGEKYP